MTTQNLQKDQKSAQLADAFRIFNELSENLSVSYQGLEEQIAKLHQELAFAHSERLNSLEEKEKLANHLEKILAALPAGVIVLNPGGRVVNSNALAVQLLGESLLGLLWAEVMSRTLIPVPNSPHERKLSNGSKVTMTCSQLECDGGQIILLSDVTEMRALQDLLNQQKHVSAMGEMVASMAHQVRTPLATAILYASQLSHSALDSEKRQKFSEKILERLLHLERQVNDMLIFAKDGRLAMERFSLSKLIQRLEEGFYDYAGKKEIEFQVRNFAPDVELIGNENALRGALMNILNNAIDAVNQSGRIEILIAHSEGSVRIAISDNGVGISEECSHRVFEPFFTTKTSGTGLGLAVVDSVVRAHGGQINVEPNLGAGTVFCLSLPVKNQPWNPLPGGFSSNKITQIGSQHEAI
jgi:two-component system, sensor histidine kinase FlrB